GIDSIQLQGGTIPAQAGEVHVDCSAAGLGTPPARPIFEPDRITIQRVQAGIDPFSAALIGVVEASDRSDRDKNRLCPPNQVGGEAIDYARDLLITLRARTAWMAEPDVREWFMTTRLSPLRDA